MALTALLLCLLPSSALSLPEQAHVSPMLDLASMRRGSAVGSTRRMLPQAIPQYIMYDTAAGACLASTGVPGSPR